MSLHESLPAGCEPTCHGCRHRSLDEAQSLAQKASYLGRVLRRWDGCLAAPVAPPAAARLGYRDRVTLTVRLEPACGWRLGLVRRDELIAIHDCPVHSPRVRALVHAIVRHLPPDPALPLAYLHVAGAQATLIVKGRGHARATFDGLSAAVSDCGIEGLWLHEHPAAGRRLFARSGWTLLRGVPRSRDSLGLLHGPTAFLQAFPALHRASIGEALAFLEPAPGRRVLDLYCGLGSTLRAWTGTGAEAIGVELSGEAVDCAAANAPDAHVLRGTCLHRLPQVRDWWCEGDPGRGLAYVNPPRSGLEAEVARVLASELRPLRLAYLSCSAGTLARDLAMFEDAGYRVHALRPYDFFPLTHHVEVLALLTRD